MRESDRTQKHLAACRPGRSRGRVGGPAKWVVTRACLLAILATALRVGGVCGASAERPTTATASILGETVAEPARTRGRASSETLTVLGRLDGVYGDVKTVQARFEQVKVWQDSGDQVESSGRLYLQMPGRMRCEYAAPFSEVLLFTDNAFYQYVKEYKQVDAFRFETADEGRERLKMLMLGFGVSSKEVLDTYDVELAAGPRGEEGEVPPIGFVFTPIRPEVRKMLTSITVWFEREKLWPIRAIVNEVSGDVTTVTIKEMQLGGRVKASLFEAKWPRDVDVIEH